MRTALLAAAACGAMAWRIHLTPPPKGTVDQATGFVDDLPDNVHVNEYKVVVLLSGDYGATWWDKTHGQYLLAGVPDPGDAQNAGCPLDANWRYTLNPPWSASAVNDGVAALWRAYLLRSTFDLRWPQYQIEGIPMRGDVINEALAWVQVNRDTGEEQHGQGLERPDGVMAQPPAPSAAATPAASPTATLSPGASPSTTRSPSPSFNSSAGVTSGAWRNAGIAVGLPALVLASLCALM